MCVCVSVLVAVSACSCLFECVLGPALALLQSSAGLLQALTAEVLWGRFAAALGLPVQKERAPPPPPSPPSLLLGDVGDRKLRGGEGEHTLLGERNEG